MNENVPKSIRKGNIEEKLKEKEKELKQINSIIFELKNKEIAEVLDDDHSPGAFRVIVGKLPKPQ